MGNADLSVTRHLALAKNDFKFVVSVWVTLTEETHKGIGLGYRSVTIVLLSIHWEIMPLRIALASATYATAAFVRVARGEGACICRPRGSWMYQIKVWKTLYQPLLSALT